MESAEYRQVPLEHIIVGPYNLRGEHARTSPSLLPLKNSIGKDGLLHPPGVIQNPDGTYTLVYGHRRFWSIEQYLKERFPTLPVRIIPKEQANELTANRIAIAENLNRKSLNPIDLAKKLLALRNAGFNNRDIAAEVGYETEGAVTDVIKLLSLEPDVQAGLMDGSLAMGHGRALLKLLRYPAHQLAALQQLEQLMKKERTVRRLEGIIKALLAEDKGVPVQLTLPKAVTQHELADGTYRVIIEFSAVSELLAKASDILAHNGDLPHQMNTGNQENLPPWEYTASAETDGGVVMCRYCEHDLSLTHLSDDTHQVKPYARQHPEDQQELPGLFP